MTQPGDHADGDVEQVKRGEEPSDRISFAVRSVPCGRVLPLGRTRTGMSPPAGSRSSLPAMRDLVCVSVARVASDRACWTDQLGKKRTRWRVAAAVPRPCRWRLGREGPSVCGRHGWAVGVVEHERVVVERCESGREHRAHEFPHGVAHRAVAAGQGVAELSRHPFRAERLAAGDAGRIEGERGAEPGGQLRDPPERVGVCERSLELGVGDRVQVVRLVAAGVADGLLALGVGPAGAVGDQLVVVADEQPADDVPDSAQLGFAGLDQSGADVVPEPDIAARGFGLARSRWARRCSSSAAASRSSSSSIRAPAK